MKIRLVICAWLGGAALAANAASSGLQVVQPEQVCAAVHTLLMPEAERQGVKVRVDCPNARAVEVDSGALAWSLRSPSPPLAAGPSRLVLQVTVNGMRPRAVGVPVVLALNSKAWVALRPVAAGEPLTAADMALRDVSWPVGVAPTVAADVAPIGRARQALKAGDVVSASRLTAPGQKLQGDTVTVAVHSGGVTLEAPAVLTSNAQVGQAARVQLRGRHDTLEGVLVDASTVIVER